MSNEIVFEQEIERILFGITPELEEEEPLKLDIHRKRIIVLAGPTSCGKSAISLMLAQAMGGEIVSADSMQVYRGLDIGTAKVSVEERKIIPHHLIDIRDLNETFNVVEFFHEARQAFRTIHDRDNIPIVVGGSGFYIHTLLYGPPSGPPPVPELRKGLEETWEKLGPDLLFKRLQELDPLYAATITCHDKQKILRALEIITLTGRKVSKHLWKGRKKAHDYDFRCWFLHRPRTTLYHRIEKRCEKMVEEGLLEEVQALEKKGIRQNSTVSQAIGYRQTLDYLSTPQTKEEYKKYMEEFKKATRHYAKKQFTWFRREPLFRWLDLDLHDPETALDMIMQDYETLRWE